MYCINYSDLLGERSKKNEYGIKFVRDSRDCWIYESERFNLDPLHLPRAPILRHNVSLCHGRATPLFSPSATPAVSSIARSRVYGILDFGNSVVRIAHSWMQVAPVLHRGGNTPERGRKGGGETVFQHTFPLSITRLPLPIYLFYAFSESTSESMMQPRMSRENILSLCDTRDILSEFLSRSFGKSQFPVIMFSRWFWEIDEASKCGEILENTYLFSHIYYTWIPTKLNDKIVLKIKFKIDIIF